MKCILSDILNDLQGDPLDGQLLGVEIDLVFIIRLIFGVKTGSAVLPKEAIERIAVLGKRNHHVAIGGCLGFLVWNFHPAKVFMGDTGSMFLGGIVALMGVAMHVEVLMVIASAVYIWEALTVLIQTTYFKITHGKRLFKMTPIHHSFELRGWSEKKIVIVFSLIGAVAGTAAILLVQGL